MRPYKNIDFRNKPGYTIVSGLLLFLFLWQSVVLKAQNKVDFGIFASATPDRMEIRLRPNYTEVGNQYLTNIQLTVKWPASSGITALAAEAGIYPYLLSPQGPPYSDSGYFYQIWASPGGNLISWSQNQEVVIQAFTYATMPCALFEIAHDNYVQNVINGDYYIEVNGNPNLTGQRYQAVASQGMDTAGSISGMDTVYAGYSNIAYVTAPLPSALSYTWTYSGTGVSIAGTGDTAYLSFAADATSGILTVAGHNACGDGLASPPLEITVLSDAGAFSLQAADKQVLHPYPNPSDGSAVFVDIDNKTGKAAEAEIYNLRTGLQTRFSLPPTNGTSACRLPDLSSFSSGLYILSIRLGPLQYTAKIIKN